MDIKDYTTSQLDDIMAGRTDWVDGAEAEFEARSEDMNERLDAGEVTLTKEEVDAGVHKVLHPDYVRCTWNDDGTAVLNRDCFVARNYYED